MHHWTISIFQCQCAGLKMHFLLIHGNFVERLVGCTVCMYVNFVITIIITNNTSM